LYGRISKLGEHWVSLGDRLGKAVDAYNCAKSTLETRVLVSARRFRELKAAGEGVEIEMPAQIERVPRQVQGLELLAANDVVSSHIEVEG
jgi:DNA recombination protein RmuC